MSKNYVTALLATTCLMTLVCENTAAAQQAGGQQAQSPVIEEVIVNARRVEENLQRVPIAITAVSNETLTNQQITSSFDIAKALPGITICCYPEGLTSGRVINSWVRGVRGVVPYFAEVPIAVNGNAAYFDLENVQLLKGPQGTLFGTATDGGALLFTPTKPRDTFEGYVEGSLGNYRRREIQGVINVPVIPDKLLVRAGVSSQKRDGYIKELANNVKLGDQDYWVGRITVTFRPSEVLENIFLANYYDSSNRPLRVIPTNPEAVKVGGTSLNPNGITNTIFGQAARDQFARQDALGPYVVPDGGIQGGAFAKTKQWNLINTTTWNITETIALKNILAYQEIRQFALTDSNGGALPLLSQPVLTLPNGAVVGPNRTETAIQYSDEIQIQGKIFDDRLNFTIGSFNSRDGQLGPHAVNYSNTLGGISGARTDSDTIRTNAVFGQGTYDLSDFIEGLSFTAGYRYTWDKAHSAGSSFRSDQTLSGSRDSTAKFSAGSYTLQLTYQYSADTMFFVNNSKGYSRGGFNTVIGLPANLVTYQPESLNNIEVGVKTDFEVAGMRARTNFSGYYGFYDNVQVSVPVTFVDVNTGLTRFTSLNQNAAEGHIYGLDGDFSIIPVDPITLNFSVAYLQARYDRYVSGGVDVSQTPFILAPTWKYVIRGTYRLPIDSSLGELSLSANYNWQSRWVGQAELNPPIQDTNPPFGNLDMNLTWKDFVGTEGLNATLFVTNLTNNIYTDSMLPVWNSLGYTAITPAAPRMWGARVRYSF